MGIFLSGNSDPEKSGHVRRWGNVAITLLEVSDYDFPLWRGLAAGKEGIEEEIFFLIVLVPLRFLAAPFFRLWVAQKESKLLGRFS